MSGNRLQNALLTVGAVLGTLCLLVAVVGGVFGFKPLMFRSGSMEPTIPTGALALSIPVNAADIHVGDIVSLENSTGTRLTHRVAAVTPGDGYSQLVLKGDANDAVDAEVYPVATVDRVFWSVPVFGYVLAGLTSPLTTFLSGLLAAYLLYLAFVQGVSKRAPRSPARRRAVSGPSRRRARQPSSSRRNHALRRGTTTATVAAIALTGSGLHEGGSAWAQFSDQASSNTQVSAKLPAPQVACTTAAGSAGVTLSWSYTDGPATANFTILRQDGSEWSKQPAVGSMKIYISAREVQNDKVLGGLLDLFGGSQIVSFGVRASYEGWSSTTSTKTNYTAPVGLGEPTLACSV